MTAPDFDLGADAYRRRIRHYQREMKEDLGYAFFIFLEKDETLLGGLTVSNVRRGVTQAGALGGLFKPAMITGLDFSRKDLP